MDVRVVTGAIMLGFAAIAAVEISWLVRHRNDLKTISPGSPEVTAELRRHRESRMMFGVIRAIGGVLMTLLLAWLTFFVKPGNPEWSGF